jgi:hypothetical protein
LKIRVDSLVTSVAEWDENFFNLPQAGFGEKANGGRRG